MLFLSQVKPRVELERQYLQQSPQGMPQYKNHAGTRLNSFDGKRIAPLILAQERREEALIDTFGRILSAKVSHSGDLDRQLH